MRWQLDVNKISVQLSSLSYSLIQSRACFSPNVSVVREWIEFSVSCWLQASVTCALGGSFHYSDVVMTVMASQSTGVSIVCSTVCSGTDQRKLQSSLSLSFVGVGRGGGAPTKVTEKSTVSDTFMQTCYTRYTLNRFFCEITIFIRFWRQSWIYLSINRYLWVYNHTHFTFNLNNISKQNFIIPWPE